MDNSQEVETPKITEKVRFWEEQDRINKELIPRVIKQHELFTAHIEGHETTSIRIGAVEARMREAVEAVRKQTAEELDAQISALETHVSESIGLAKRQAAEEASKQLSALEVDMTATVSRVKRQAMTVSGISLIVAAASIIFALVS